MKNIQATYTSTQLQYFNIYASNLTINLYFFMQVKQIFKP